MSKKKSRNDEFVNKLINKLHTEKNTFLIWVSPPVKKVTPQILKDLVKLQPEKQNLLCFFVFFSFFKVYSVVDKVDIHEKLIVL